MQAKQIFEGCRPAGPIRLPEWTPDLARINGGLPFVGPCRKRLCTLNNRV